LPCGTGRQTHPSHTRQDAGGASERPPVEPPSPLDGVGAAGGRAGAGVVHVEASSEEAAGGSTTGGAMAGSRNRGRRRRGLCERRRHEPSVQVVHRSSSCMFPALNVDKPISMAHVTHLTPINPDNFCDRTATSSYLKKNSLTNILRPELVRKRCLISCQCKPVLTNYDKPVGQPYILAASSQNEMILEAPPRRIENGRSEINHATTVESRGVWVHETSTTPQCRGFIEVFFP